MAVKNPVKNWAFDYDVCHSFCSLNHFLRTLIKSKEVDNPNLHLRSMIFIHTNLVAKN